MSIHSMDTYTQYRVKDFEAWQKSGKLRYSSKVIPLDLSIPASQWILPTMQAQEQVEQAELFAVKRCGCRTHHRNCSNPTDVCILLDRSAHQWIQAGEAKKITRGEVNSILKCACDHNLVHLSIFIPDDQTQAICSCCACCCHELRALILYDKTRMIARADYLVSTQADACSHCGICVERCVFGARTRQDGEVVFHDRACYGCGLCVTSCPTGAIFYAKR